MLKLCIFFYFRILLLINRTRTNSVICVQNFLRKWRGDKFCRFCYGIDNLPALFFHSSVSRVLRNMVRWFLLLHNVINKKRYISKGMLNVWLKVTIEKFLESSLKLTENFDFLSLRNLPPGQFLGSPNSGRFTEF